jgi:hypothetical protein
MPSGPKEMGAMTEQEQDYLNCLTARMNYLEDRVAIKKKHGWEWSWDERERAATEWAIGELTSGQANNKTEAIR